MTNPRYVAAIEVCSSKVIGAVGKIFPDGKLNVIATAEEKCVECVRFGIVQNVEETATRIARIISQLERNHEVEPRRITGVFIGLSGRSMRSISAEVSLTLPEETVIDARIVEELRDKAVSKAIDSSLEVIDAVPRSYTIGKNVTKEPTGNVGSSIKATYDLIACRPQLKRNLGRTGLTDRFEIHINGYIVTALAAGALIPNDSEKRLGCMLVDMGAETTTVTIYKDGNLQYFATLPLGSRNITRDITSLNLLEESAEDIKIQSGNAIAGNSNAALNIHGVDLQEISNIIVARAEEIVVNIMEQVTYAGFKDSDLPGGIILIGGGAQLNNMAELMRRTCKLPVHPGQLPSNYISFSGKTPSPEAYEVISVLYAGATHSDAECLSMPRAEMVPPTGTIPDNPGEESQTPGEKGKEKKPKQPSKLSIFMKRLSKALTPEPEDEESSDLME